jgi:hypothetical protein
MVTVPPFNVAPRRTVRFPATVAPDTEQVVFLGTTTLSYDPNGSSPSHLVAIAALAGVAARALRSAAQIRSLMSRAKCLLTDMAIPPPDAYNSECASPADSAAAMR